ncbi:MAG: DUF1800 family protein, partial [Usitatibacteraceae bacterium]
MRRNFRFRAVTIAASLFAIFASLSASALTLTGAQSRKVHGAAGTYDLPLDRTALIAGAITVESRVIGAGHTIVFQFDGPITTTGTVSAVDVAGGPIGSASAVASGNDVIVTLTNISDNRRATVKLAGVNTTLNTEVSIGFLAGDINNTFSVNASDISAIKARSGQTVTIAANNFKFDINVSGSINSSDISAVKARTGVTLGTTPPPAVTMSGVAAQVSVTTTLSANATIGAGGVIARVEYYEGTTKIAESTSAPYSANWTPAVEGSTALSARAIDANGAYAISSAVNVAVAPHPKADAARLLAQATFGASLNEINRVAAMTPATYIEEQFNIAQTSHLNTVRNDPLYPTAPYSVMTPSIWKQYFEAPDQLRQRVANALSQIMVISMNNNTIGDQACAPASYLDLLGANAFGNFRNLIKDVTLSPAMGEYLDMKGSAKADLDPRSPTIPSENYARELMQLFTIGTVMLNIDGSVQFDAGGKPINTYSEETAQEVARALTGWNHAGQNQADAYKWLYPDVPYPSATNAAKACTGWSAPMEPWLTSYRSSDGGSHLITGGAHDMGAKTLLTYPGSTGFSQNLPAGQTAVQDLDSVINNLFNHPNVGPFIGEQLIQRLITSNPSSAYVTRVANAFNNNGSGVRGDMKAVIRAIYLDPEARTPVSAQPASFGKLREPIMRFTHLHRAFDAKMSGGYYSAIYDLGGSDSIGQSPLRAGSVFNFYHPDYSPSGPLAVAQLVGPEFEIANSATISGFMDFSKYGIIGGFNSGQATTNPAVWLQPVYSPYTALAGNPAAMIDALNLTLLSGGISAQFRNQLIDVVSK